MDISHAKTINITEPELAKRPNTSVTRSIYIKSSNPYKIMLGDDEPSMSRAIRNDFTNNMVKTDSKISSDIKDRSCSKQKITLSNKTKSMNFYMSMDVDNKSWLDPFFTFFGGVSTS
jgi:hypothetical protein